MMYRAKTSNGVTEHPVSQARNGGTRMPYGVAFAALVVWTLSAALCPLAAAEPEVACWRAHEFVFTSDRDYAAPLADVTVSATFTHEDGTRIVRPVFWDGERTWRVRFAPTKAGTWSMLTDCSEAADGGLSRVRRSLRAVPYAGDLAIYRHGFLTIAANGRYLTHADGTPFLWASEDHAIMDKESWSESNKPGTASQFKYIADLRRQQGLSVYQSVVWVLDYWQTPQRPNLEPFHDLDRKYAYLADLGFVSAIALGYHKHLGDGEPDPEKVAAMKLMARYVEGRYGAYPMAYYTCGEFNIPYEGRGTVKDPSRVGPGNSYIRSWWGEIGAVIHAHNTYGHPSSINYWQQQGTWFSDQPFHRYWSIQGYSLRGPNYYAYWYKQEPAKPIIDSFSGMDRGTEKSQQTQRAIGWLVMQSGGAGFGCLTEGIWNNCYTKDSGIAVKQWGGTPWFTTVDWPGAAQIGHVRKFYSSIDWWKLKPQTRGGRFYPHSATSLSADGEGTYVIYFGNQKDATGWLLDLVPERSYRARWFDPRHGTFTEEIPVTVATGGIWEIPKRPTAEDWTLLVQPVVAAGTGRDK